MTYEAVVVRHGQTPANAEERFADKQESQKDELSDLGIQQCKALRERFKREGRFFRHYFHGPLTRQLQSAHLMFPTQQYDWEVICDLDEKQTPPQFAGRLGSEVEAEMPGILARWHRCELNPPGGETQAEFMHRVWKFMESELKPACLTGPTIIITSAWVINAMIAHPKALAIPPRNWFNLRISNTSITTLKLLENGDWQALSIGDTNHLRALA